MQYWIQFVFDFGDDDWYEAATGTSDAFDDIFKYELSNVLEYFKGKKYDVEYQV